MEFLKTCDTNAQAIGDFEAVAFQAFSVARNPTRSASGILDGSPSNDIRAAEAELRQGHHLVIQDASRPWLWLFRAVTLDQVGQQPTELPTLEHFRLHRQQYGTMKALELERRTFKSSAQSTPLSATSNSPSTLGPQKGQQPVSSRQSQGSTQLGTSDQQQYDPHAIYELFTSSVVALISFHLVKDHSAVALNFRTFASSAALQQDAPSPGSSTRPPLRLTTVQVLWASSGTLVVSTLSLIKPDLHCLDQITSDEEQKRLIGTCVRVAPNGMLAKVISFTDPLETATEDVAPKLQRKRPKASPLERSIERWKASVKQWLAWKGYSIPSLESKAAWVRIQPAYESRSVSVSPAPFRPARDIMWPRALCFYFGDSTMDPRLQPNHEYMPLQGADALAWFETSHTKGFNDPMDFAQHWYIGKAERDKIFEARKKAKRVEEEAARAKEETQSLFPSSPLNARIGTYGDLQSVSGVYPTPPDGVPPGTAVSSGDTPSVSGLATNVILAPGGNNPAINLSAPPETTSADAQQQPLTSSDLPVPYDEYHADGNNDDLFEDIEEDRYEEGNGVTDADFNFFDEPDEEDVVMPDAPTIEESKPLSDKKRAKEKRASTPLRAPVKEEPPDPMTALDDALASASAEQSMQDMKIETQSGKEEEAAAPTPVPANPPQPEIVPAQALDRATKDPTPPLSPRFIEAALLPSPKNKVPPSHHRNSVFDPLNFSRKMSISDAKYKIGRFGFTSEKPKKTDEIKDDDDRSKSLRDLPLLTKLRYAIGVASADSRVGAIPVAAPDSDISDTSSEISSVVDDEEDDVTSIGLGPLPASLIIPIKRKLPSEGTSTPLSATSFADSFGGDFGELAGLQTDEAALGSLEPTSWDWSLLHAPQPKELLSNGSRYSIPGFAPIFSSVPNTPTSPPDLSMDLIEEPPLSGKDSIAIAQIATAQIASATLDILQEGPVGYMDRPLSEAFWQGAVKTIFPKAVGCNTIALASIQDVYPPIYAQMKGQQRPPPRKANETATTLGHHMNQINPPYIRVRRADTLWDLLPPALSFWEPLGLSPCSPSKNVVAFGIYPYSEALNPCVESFLVNMQLAFDSCKLGNHARVDVVPEYAGGLVPCKITSPSSTRVALRAFRNTCIQLGKTLAAKHAQMRDKDDSKIDAFVIYIIDPFEKSSAIWELCSAFWALFQSYGQGPPGRPEQVQKPDLVLQIVPIKYVASFEAPVILDSSTYTRLAREVYDRCPPSAPSEEKTPLSIYTAPSFQLEEPIPRLIPFKLNADTPQDLLRENSYMHIGYAVSLDGTWVTVAWSDTCGKSQTVVSYNLGLRPFSEIAQEVWQTTIEILQARRVTWRVCIARAGFMEREEFEAWVFLVSCPTQLSLFITILTLDTEPHLKFTPTMPSTNPSGNPSSAPHASTNTPGSTPQAVVSPEQGLTPAATPTVDNSSEPATDPDARLVDITDDTWGIILAHRMHNSNSTNEYRPALISGLLCKRGCSAATTAPPSSPGPLVGPIVSAINILWMGAVNPTRAATSPFPSGDGISPGGGNMPVGTGTSPQERSYSSLTWTPTVQTRTAAENMLREVLGQYRGLGLLARLRGVRGCRHGAVPWHVAVAVKGVEGLAACAPP